MHKPSHPATLLSISGAHTPSPPLCVQAVAAALGGAGPLDGAALSLLRDDTARVFFRVSKALTDEATNVMKVGAAPALRSWACVRRHDTLPLLRASAGKWFPCRGLEFMSRHSRLAQGLQRLPA